MTEFISKFWIKFKWYRKRKGGTWYLVKVPPGSSTTGFEFWSRFPPSVAWGESSTIMEEYEK